MKRIWFFFLCIQAAVFGSFFEEEDPMHYYHVNVITGHLDLSFQDIALKSPIPFSVLRSYTSGGALERTPDDVDLLLKNLRKSGWMFQGGWSLLPHANLLVQRDINHNLHKAYLCEKNSNNLICYSHYKRKKRWNYLRPVVKNNRASGNLSARKKLKHNVLKITKNFARLKLPDGSERHYSGNSESPESYWRLDLEILPSKHRIAYHYSRGWEDGGNLLKIELQNPKGTKAFASIDFDHSSYKAERLLHAKTSDGKMITYQMGPEFKERTYLQNVETSIRPKEAFHYQSGRKGIGARLAKMCFGDKEPLKVEYHLPPSKKKEKKWAKKPRKHQQGDKVKSLQFPDPEQGQWKEVAKFSYFPEYTDVEDHEGVVTRFIHDGEKLISIEHFDNTRALHSKVAFEWDNDNLKSKKLLDGNGHLLFSKSFSYDDAGNVIEELWEDHKTNSPPVRRKFSYSKSRLILFEEESGGLSHRYSYLLKTDLLKMKLTLYKGKILLREFWFYNEDNLLICKVTDDGSAIRFDNLIDVTERKIQRFDLDPATGLCTCMAESYFDLNTATEITFRQYHYSYNEKREVTAETIIYGGNEESYTSYLEYDESGQLIKQTSPLGRENSFIYDDQGNLLSSKEVGSPLKRLQYDFANRPKCCHEAGETTQSLYDIKGRLISQTDSCGNTTYQTYDCFGRSIQSQFPKVFDADGYFYAPIVHYTYDVQNNLISYTNPQGQTTTTEYNILRKPTLIQYPDGSWLSHAYNQDGTISKTLYPDHTATLFTYDPFQRMTSKITTSAEGEVLSEESWVYNTFHLLSYTNPLGLTTYYQYDPLGRKIAERAEDRLITYTYDHFGFLEKAIEGDFSKVELHNIEGEIIEQWEEDASGKVENHMLFFYDLEGRKEKAIRITSQGNAEDTFQYDDKGRLCQHIDPLGAQTQWIYAKITNAQGQTVEQKITLDPLGNALVETYDANGRIVLIEKKDPQNKTVAREQLSYDEAGNTVKRLVTVFDQNRPLRTHTTTWKHSEKGLVLQELEEGKKSTIFQYDSRGRIAEKTLPSGITLYQKYDGLDRLLALKSSDGTVDYEYSYGKGSFPTHAVDNVRHLHWEREFNLFQELISETRPDGSTLYWSYDSRGRCIKYTLPDHSSIRYYYTGLHLGAISRHDPHGELQYTHRYTQFDTNGHIFQEELIHNLGTITTTHDLLERADSLHTPWNRASITYGPSGLVMKTENSLFRSKEYQYDPLNQLLREGNHQYQFDSLGNPLDAQINPLNQIVSTSLCALTYNVDGSPVQQDEPNQVTTYIYDALGRLTTRETLNQAKVHYTYDPFSRLYSKEAHLNQPSFFFNYDNWSKETSYFLYDKEKEIGTFDDQHTLRELKVTGLGILGDIGAAVAIELKGETFAPLHDFNGNIIALISSKGTLVEKCEIDAFGKTILTTSSINPWRFHSKRTEGHLIYFGERFYNPNLGRWLTPDPAGSFESPNLYLYVCNSPLNRLDLFGLYSEDFRTEIPISSLIDNSSPYLRCTAYYDEIQSDWLIYCNHFHRLQFSPEELQVGKIDILHHFHELFFQDGQGVGLSTFENGICNTFEDFSRSANFLVTTTPEDGVFIGIYIPTQGAPKDIITTQDERARKIETPEIIMTRQAMVALSETLSKVSPNLLWSHLNHSRAGTVGCAAIEGMNKEEQDLVKEKLLWVGIASSEPLANEWVVKAINFYSNKDGITSPYARGIDKMQKHLPPDKKLYDIQFLECTSKRSERVAYVFDHALMGTTYRNKVIDVMNDFKSNYGFYEEKR